jgi:hypothetical protein
MSGFQIEPQCFLFSALFGDQEVHFLERLLQLNELLFKRRPQVSQSELSKFW